MIYQVNSSLLSLYVPSYSFGTYKQKNPLFVTLFHFFFVKSLLRNHFTAPIFVLYSWDLLDLKYDVVFMMCFNEFLHLQLVLLVRKFYNKVDNIEIHKNFTFAFRF